MDVCKHSYEFCYEIYDYSINGHFWNPDSLNKAESRLYTVFSLEYATIKLP